MWSRPILNVNLAVGWLAIFYLCWLYLFRLFLVLFFCFTRTLFSIGCSFFAYVTFVSSFWLMLFRCLLFGICYSLPAVHVSFACFVSGCGAFLSLFSFITDLYFLINLFIDFFLSYWRNRRVLAAFIRRDIPARRRRKEGNPGKFAITGFARWSHTMAIRAADGEQHDSLHRCS